MGTLIDRLLRNAENLSLGGKSYQLKQAEERAARKVEACPEAKIRDQHK